MLLNVLPTVLLNVRGQCILRKIMSNSETHTQLDPQRMLQSIDMLSQQVRHAWESVKQTTITPPQQEIHLIVLFGMGGSALGMHIVQSLFADQLTVPIQIVNGYTIPTYVNEHTLVILSSYSGNTEEVMKVAQHITERTSHIVVMTAGGALEKFKHAHQFPGYVIEPTYNPCNQPRIAVGYMIVGLMALLTKLGFITITDTDIDDSAHYLEGNKVLLHDDAQAVAKAALSKIPMYVASEFLAGNVHTLANQTNENGKQFAAWFLLPELNHHLMEGLSHPEGLPVHFVFIESNFYHERNQKRYPITKQVIEKNQVSHSTFIATARNPLLQTFEVLQWGSYLSFYLAMFNQVDPSPIPWVDFFKDALK